MKTLKIHRLRSLARAGLVAALAMLGWCLAAEAQQEYSFGNLAGNPGVTGTANGTGSAALFNNLMDVAVDGNGNVYVADSKSSTIRKVTPAAVVTTLAGKAGVSGTVNGSGSAALFGGPQGIAVDGNGNLYVADGKYNTIRKVTATGVVTTLAGKPGVSGTANGTGSAALFSDPQGITVDGSGNLYVADGRNNTIRKVTSAGAVTTFAGTPGVSGTSDGTGSAAQFNAPAGLAADGFGNIYVADGNNDTIRKVTSAGVVTTLAGIAGVPGAADGAAGTAQFNAPTGVAVDVFGNIYVADAGNGTIREVLPAAGVVTTLGGTAGVTGNAGGLGAAAQFQMPSGVAVDCHGNLYVADTSNSRISVGAPQQITGGGCGFNAAIGAVVSGSANPNGSTATVWFEYGTSSSYGSQTAAQGIGNGSNFVGVSGTLTNLALGSIYHYCLVFASGASVFYGADRTLNVPGYLVNAATLTGTSVTFSASVDPDGAAGPSTNKTNVLVSWQYGTGLVSGSYYKVTTAQAIGMGTSVVTPSLRMGKGSFLAAVYHYRLLISSTLGNTYGPDQMFSVEPPTLTYSAPAATGTDANLSVTVNPNGLDTTVSIQYGLTTGYTGGTIAVGDIGSGTTAVSLNPDLTGLAANMAYHYRVVTTNVLGTVYGPDQMFATLPLFGTGAVASTSDTATGIAGAVFSAFGDPAINDLDHVAFQATVTGSAGSGIGAANNSGIWAGSGASGRILIVRTGALAPSYPSTPGLATGTFATLSDPVYANDDAIAFLGTLLTGTAPTSLNKTNSTGIWATTTGTLALVARAGDLAPDATGMVSAGGPVFGSFTEFVLPDQGGVVMLATLVTGTGGVITSNDQGIWAVDTDGLLKQIIRTGEALTINGNTRVISALSIFNAPTASTGQTRHFNSAGDLAYKVSFTDKTTSIVQSVFP